MSLVVVLDWSVDGMGKTVDDFIYDTIAKCVDSGLSPPPRIALGRGAFRYLIRSLLGQGRTDVAGCSSVACWGVLIELDWKLAGTELSYEERK